MFEFCKVITKDSERVVDKVVFEVPLVIQINPNFLNSQATEKIVRKIEVFNERDGIN